MKPQEAVATTAEIGLDPMEIELASMDEFVRANYSRLIRLAGLITRDVDQAQDAVQAAIERAWRKRNDVRERAKLRAWLDRIVVREAIRHSGASRFSWLSRTSTTEWTQLQASTAEPSDVIDLRNALGRLSPRHRAVVALHLYEGYTVEETARTLGVPLDTVRSRLRAARERLRRDLGGHRP